LRPNDRLTTEQVLSATRTTREQLYLWIAQEMLTRPMIATTAQQRHVALWPRATLARVRFADFGHREHQGRPS